jgi:DNA-directed RNA polymerase specialized sigma24 family protein
MSPTGIDWSALPWKELIPRLLLYTHHRLRHTSLGTSKALADDYVLGAIEKTIAGSRNWDPARVGLFEHLVGVISSDVYNEVRKTAAERHIPLDTAVSETVVSDAPTPEDDAAFKLDIAKTLAFLRERDEQLARMADAIVFLGVDKPQELAAFLGISVDEVNRQKGRLKRLLQTLGWPRSVQTGIGDNERARH